LRKCYQALKIPAATMGYRGKEIWAGKDPGFQILITNGKCRPILYSICRRPQALNNLVSLSRKSVSLQCAVIGAGLGWTLCRKLSSVVKGHLVTLYERHGFGGGIGARIGVVSNETYFLEKQWNVDMSKSRPIVSKKMARHDWKTRQVQGEAPVGDYKAKFGTDYYGYNYQEGRDHA
jgi:hypothetical protein